MKSMTTTEHHKPHSAPFSPLIEMNGGGNAFQPRFGELARASSFTRLDLTSGVPTPGSDAITPMAQEAVEEARQQAEQIVVEAQAHAAEQAQAQIAAAVQAVRLEQTEAFGEAARNLLTSLQEQTEAHLRELEREAAGLVIDLVRRVLYERFTADASAIVPVVREALRPLAEDGRVRVVVAPQHSPALHEAYQELMQVLQNGAHLDIVLSESAAPGGCVVHGDSASIDARLDTRLRMLEDTVQETLISATAA